MALAAEMAARAGCRQVEPEHFLAALAATEVTDAELLLSSFEIDLTSVVPPVKDRIPYADHAATSADTTLSDAGRAVMREMYAEHRRTARLLIGSFEREVKEFVDTRHLLLAIADSDTDAGRCLRTAKFSLDEWRRRDGLSTAPRFHEAIDTLLQSRRSDRAKAKTTIPEAQSDSGPIMWQRFTERARKVVIYAQEEAIRCGQNRVDTEHLLLGLVRENDNVAARILDRLNVPLGRIRSEIRRQAVVGDSMNAKKIELTSQSKRVIDRAYEEARRLSNNYLGTEHLLLGLIRDADGLAGRILSSLHVDLARSRSEVVAMQGRPPDEPRQGQETQSQDGGEQVMWQQFTEQARKVVFYSQEEAGRLGENYVSTEHILLGLVRDDDNVAVRILDMLGISPGRIRAEVERKVARGDGRLGNDMQLTPRAKRVIDIAYVEARMLNHNYIGTEHLLLGLIREGEGLAGRILTKLGATLDKARTAVSTFQPLEQTEEGGAAEERPPQTAVRHPVMALFEAIKRSQPEAERFGRPPDLEHVILVAMADENSVVSRMQTKCGVTIDQLREALKSVYAEDDAQTDTPEEGG